MASLKMSLPEKGQLHWSTCPALKEAWDTDNACLPLKASRRLAARQLPLRETSVSPIPLAGAFWATVRLASGCPRRILAWLLLSSWTRDLFPGFLVVLGKLMCQGSCLNCPCLLPSHLCSGPSPSAGESALMFNPLCSFPGA